jgi:hypothetical protein
MSDSDQPVPQLRLDQRQSLSASWLLRLVRDAGYEVPQTSLSMTPFIIGRPDDFHIAVTPQDSAPWISAVSSDQSRQNDIDELVKRSGKAASGDLKSDDDFGGLVWYQCRLVGEQLNFAEPMFQSRWQERMHLATRILDWRRLGWSVLLNFSEDVPEGGVPEQELMALNLPTPIVDVYIAVPGPIDGPFTRPIAHGISEVVAAICTFALGRPVNLPPTVWPAKTEMLDELESRRTDTSILTLARHTKPLDVLYLTAEDRQSWDRVRGALLSFDAALRQQREQVAMILYVVAAECLTNPFQSWKTERLTTRFIKFFDELMPDFLDEMVQHGNFEQAFGILRGSKMPHTLRGKLLGTLYVFRSEPVHEGLAMAYEGMSFSGMAGQRRMLASWFAEWAILSYFEAPRTSLIGHPATAPPPDLGDQPN